MAGVFFLLLSSARAVAVTWTDYLWFERMDLTDVWWGTIASRAALATTAGLFVFVLCFVNLVIADRLAPAFAPRIPDDELFEWYRDLLDRHRILVRGGVSGLLALVFGGAAATEWKSWILFRNGGSFGIRDPLFGIDVSFYVFDLPFYQSVVTWLFSALFTVLVVSSVAHFLNGGIRLQASFQRITPQVKAHLSVLAGLLALVRAGDYWLDRFSLVNSRRGTVEGATYTDVNAQLPALNLLMAIALASAVLFVLNIWRRGWVLPVLTVGLWSFVGFVAGVAYPSFVQRFRVEPAESSREAPYIARNIVATRQALGLNVMEVRRFDFDPEVKPDDIRENAETIRNIRLLDPNVVRDTFQRLQAERGFYQFRDLDIDRYLLPDGEGGRTPTQAVVAARELNPSGIPRQTWEATRLAFTHGHGIVLAPGNSLTDDGRPRFLLRDVPVKAAPEAEGLRIERPQIYFGEGLGGYAVVRTKRPEVDYIDDAERTVTTEYEGRGGVPVGGGIGGWFRRLAFALRFGEIEPLISNLIEPRSQVIFRRDIEERLKAAAPFLHFDSDPYPVIDGDGNIVWVVDGYTTSTHYPYAQTADVSQLEPRSDLRHQFNYVRNSVKAVVDAYDGTVSLYVVPVPTGVNGEPGTDPIVDAWRDAFPALFKDFDDMDPELRAHLRYPEDLFRVQTAMWARYHIDEAAAFYEQAGAWAVAQDPGASVRGDASPPQVTDPATGRVVAAPERRIDPQYLLMQLPGESGAEFVLLRSFVPISERDERKELTAFTVARGDPDVYGQLVTFEMPGTQVDGPAIVQANISNDDRVAREITLLDQQGSRVLFGNLQLIPLGETILYIRPMYVQAEGSTAVPELRKVIAVFGERVAMGDTLRDALAGVFRDAAVVEAVDEVLGTTPSPPSEGEGRRPGSTEAAPTEPGATPPTAERPGESDDRAVLVRALELLREADAALDGGDLGGYQRKIDEARKLLEEAASPSG
ncbi:MAG: UPF0182 protein [Acidimicrobiales bacterium]|nr:MAG: UPF0182 protein [Acidimicrobiales bacterium]